MLYHDSPSDAIIRVHGTDGTDAADASVYVHRHLLEDRSDNLYDTIEGADYETSDREGLLELPLYCLDLRGLQVYAASLYGQAMWDGSHGRSADADLDSS